MPFFVPSPAIRFPERAERVKGPKCYAKLGGSHFAAVAEFVFRNP
jgi:hypothetical protein